MKIRVGFISNSSSCSFCLSKDIKEVKKNLKEVRKLIKKWHNSPRKFWDFEPNDGPIAPDGFISELKHYFMGTADVNFLPELQDELIKLGIPKEYIGIEDII